MTANANLPVGVVGLLPPLAFDVPSDSVSRYNQLINSVNAQLPQLIPSITRAQIASFLSLPTTFTVSGFTTPGDLGAGAMYTSQGASSGGPMAIQNASGTWFQLILNGIYNVGHWGAVGNSTTTGGGTDDTVAIQNCILACYAAGGGRVYFPSAIYRCAQNNPLAPYVSGNSKRTNGITFKGDGMTASVILLDTTGAVSPMWIYQCPSVLYCVGTSFEDLGFWGGPPRADHPNFLDWFYSDVPTYAYGFQFYGDTSSAFNSNLRFTRCQTFAFQGTFDFEGTNLASEVTHMGCHYDASAQYCYLLNNVQSVNHKFLGCDISSWGDFIQIGPNNGGSVSYFGGKMGLSDAGTSTNTWIVNANGYSIINGGIQFYGLRTEFFGNYTNCFNTAGSYPVSMRDSFLLDHGTIPKPHWVWLPGAGKVTFDNVSFKNDNAGIIQFLVDSTWGDNGENGHILLKDCALPSNFSDQCSISYVGSIIAQDCTDGGGSYVGGAYHAIDFEFNSSVTAGQVSAWEYTIVPAESAMQTIQPRLKTAYLKTPFAYWIANTSTNGDTLYLPKNAIIKAIHLRKPAGGFSATSANWVVGNGNGVIHLTTNTGPANGTHIGDLDNYFYAVGDTTNERTLYLACSTTLTGSCLNGFCIVEYY